MEAKEKRRYMIKHNDGKIYVTAATLEEAIERFKEMRIETASKEITFCLSDAMFNYLNGKKLTDGKEL